MSELTASENDPEQPDTSGLPSEEAPPDKVTWHAVSVALVATLSTAAYSFMWNSVTVALPHMKGTFSATTDQITWVMIAYLIGSAVAMASVGWFTDKYGRRNVFIFVVAGFTVSQVGCGMATSLEAEVFWRMFQGLMGAPLVPLGQVFAVNAFPPGRHTQATSLWAIGFIAANVISPTIAGYVIDSYGWPWIFYIIVPISLVCLVAAIFILPKTEHTPKRMDWFGFMTLIIGLSILQIMLARAERLDWFESTEIIIETVAAGLILYLFAVHTWFSEKPFIGRGLLLNREFMIGLAFVFLLGCVLYLPMILLPLQLEQLGGYPPSEVGELMMARGVGSILSLSIASRFRDHMDLRWMMCLGLGVTAVAIWMMSQWSSEVRPFDVMLSNFVMGAAVGSVWAPMNSMTLSRLPKEIQDQGFALFYLVFDVGNAIGTAVMIALHTRQTQIGHALLAETVTPFRDSLSGGGLSAGGWDISTLSGLTVIDNEITRQALAVAYNNSYFVVAVTLAIMIPCVFLYKNPKR